MNLKTALRESGRSVRWLAEQTGYSRTYVSSVLSSSAPPPEKFRQRVLDALGQDALVPVVYRGRTVTIPRSIYTGQTDLVPLAVESAFEEAWKRSWLEEHGRETLAIAAERAWQASGRRAA